MIDCPELKLSAKDLFINDDVLRDLRVKYHPDKYSTDEDKAQAGEIIGKLCILHDSLKIKPFVLATKKETYTFVKQIATGDVADVYTTNQKIIAKVSRVVGGDKLLRTEADYLSKDHGAYKKYFPILVDQLAIRDNITKHALFYDHEPGLYMLREIYDKHKETLDTRHIGWMFRRLLVGLGVLHVNGYVHGAVFPEHLLYRVADHGLMFCGLGHITKIGETVKYKSKLGLPYYPPEVLNNKPSTAATDIFMAAKVMLEIGCGQLPLKMENFFQSCLLSQGMRPQDAWALEIEFASLLKTLFGKPKFIELEMV